MSSCDDLFQRKLQLDLERQKTDAEVARLGQIRRNRVPSEEEFDDAWRKMQEYLKDPANREAVRKEIAAKRKSQVNIGAGQPVSYKQKLRDFPERVVEDYAVLTRSLREAGQQAMPEEFALMGFTNPKKRARTLQTLSDRGDVNSWMRVLADAGDKFNGLVDDVVVVRFAHDTAKAVYADSARSALDWVRANPGEAPSPELKRKLFNQFKVALMAERHYDYVRGAWGRIGHALQGKGFEGPLKEFVDADVIGAVDEAIDMVSESEAAEGILKAGKLQPEDMQQESSIGRVMEAMDQAQTNPGAAERQLTIEVGNILQEGVDPEKALDPNKIFYNRLRNYNLLTKDWQLFNERSNALNGGSNVMMGIFGPYRQFFEDLQEFRSTAGTSISDASLKAWQANFNGVHESMLAIRDAGKQVFMDSFFEGKNMYGNNVDTYGRRFQSPEELVEELRDLQHGGSDGNLAQKALSAINPERYGRFFHAATRLWMYEKTGSSWYLRPGLRTMGAVDNVSGYAAAVYKVRHDLEVKARLQGSDQMNFFNEGRSREEGQRAMDTWINDEFQKAFYSSQPTEHQIKAYRRETGTPAEFLDDQAIADKIATERVGKDGSYGGMIPGELTREASEFSDEMRFTNRAGKPGSVHRGTYNAIQHLRRVNPLIESAVPYFTAPYLGTVFDLEMTGAFPVLKETFFKEGMTPKQIRRNRANMIMAGHVWAAAATMSALGLVVGNGPSDPKKNQQWRIQMKKEGKVPNSIAGTPMPGGFPIINTVFLLHDIAENMKNASFSKYDQLSLSEAVTGVLMGHLARSSAIGQVKTLMEVAYSNPDQQSRTGTVLGYVATGRYLPSGPIRTTERTFNSRQSNLYRDEEWTEQDFDKIDTNLMETWERRLRKAAYDLTGLAGAFGGQYKDNDWLGYEVRKPWAMDMAVYLANRFAPQLHPEDKVYAELRYMDLLAPPAELVTRRLRDVPMTDDMQKIWNDTMGTIRGQKGQLIEPAIYEIKVPVVDISAPGLVRVKEDASLVKLDMALFLYPHVKGKTFLEAARSVINSELYQNMEEAGPISFGTDAPPAQRRKVPAHLMMKALKRHYAKMTTFHMINMENPPAAVARWREMAQEKAATVSDQQLQNAGRSETLEAGKARAAALKNALQGAE